MSSTRVIPMLQQGSNIVDPGGGFSYTQLKEEPKAVAQYVKES